MRYWGARGYAKETKEQKRDRAILRQAAIRDRIARLTDNDAASIMGRVLAERATSGSVSRDDFKRAGIPDSKIDALLDLAFVRARAREPLLDQMGAST